MAVLLQVVMAVIISRSRAADPGAVRQTGAASLSSQRQYIPMVNVRGVMPIILLSR
jgi:hypothetical protein